jgi:hypothetical protein
MAIQPGVGYIFTASSQGENFDVIKPWSEWATIQNETFQQFECQVQRESNGSGGYNYFLKTYKGVVDYTWTTFPFRPEPTYPGETVFTGYEKQARITDWAVYKNGTRTTGSESASDWMASNGKLQIKNLADGGSNTWYVLISKIDWWDRDSWLSTYRLIDAEKPFVSVIPSNDATATATLLAQQGFTQSTGGVIYLDSSSGQPLGIDPPVPLSVGYTVKKIASIDWNSTTSSWDVTQYEYGPITLDMKRNVGTMGMDTGSLPSPSSYDTALTAHFNTVLNYAWFENTWAIPGYTLNSSDWWYNLIDS